MQPRLTLLCVLFAFVLWTVGISGAQTNQSLQITNGPTVEHTDSNSAVIAWSTNTNASTVLKYGTAPDNLNQNAEAPWGGVTHRVTIHNLQPNTTYYFQVASAEGQGTGTGATSTISQFKTPNGPAAASNSGQNPAQNTNAVQITNGPNVDSVGSNQAKVSWSTNAPASAVVKYGTDPNLLNQVAEAPWGSTNHQVTLTNLNPNTKYYFEIQSAQGQGTGTTVLSNISSFQTVQNGQSAMTNQH
jgi:phosphodiesterase/alkaline phosphatase D-like protein